MSEIVMIGIISRNRADWSMVQSMQVAAQHASQQNILTMVDPTIGDSLLCRARQNVAGRFLEDQNHPDYLLTVDDDIVLPPNAITKLVEADKDIIGGYYRTKQKRYELSCRDIDEDNSDDTLVIRPMKYMSSGCLLIKRETMQKMWDHYKKTISYSKNWAVYAQGTNKTRVAFYSPFILDDEYLSEDWAFCQRALDIGLEVYGHGEVLCGHMGLYNYSLEEQSDDNV